MFGAVVVIFLIRHFLTVCTGFGTVGCFIYGISNPHNLEDTFISILEMRRRRFRELIPYPRPHNQLIEAGPESWAV